jgi:hypothetical protein
MGGVSAFARSAECTAAGDDILAARDTFVIRGRDPDLNRILRDAVLLSDSCSVNGAKLIKEALRARYEFLSTGTMPKFPVE